MAEGAGGQDRTESPTPRRRREARDEGRVPRSQELAAATVLLAGAALLAAAGGQELTGYMARVMRESARSLSAVPLTPDGAVGLLRETATGMVMAMLPFALGMVGLVAFVNLAQARGVLTLKPITPKLSNLSPLAGLRRIVSLDSLFNLLKSVVKVAVLGFITWQVLKACWPELASLAGAGPIEIALVSRALGFKLAVTVGLAFLVVAAGDYAWQWFRHEKSLRMSRQEVVLEHRETEGDPVVKGHMLALARARARRRMLQRVPTADVVVTNPTHVAVALKYDVAAAPAPVVVAMGERKLAERIKALALKAGVPVIENRPVARALLATCTVGKMIPPALYAAVAEVLAFVYRQRTGRPAELPPRAERRAS